MKRITFADPGDTYITIEQIEKHNLRGRLAKCFK